MSSTADPRLLVVGPCSIHDPVAAIEYAEKLVVGLSNGDELLILMRVYFEKPRTTAGWKGLINDPHLNDSFDINTGLATARRLLRDITEMVWFLVQSISIPLSLTDGDLVCRVSVGLPRVKFIGSWRLVFPVPSVLRTAPWVILR